MVAERKKEVEFDRAYGCPSVGVNRLYWNLGVGKSGIQRVFPEDAAFTDDFNFFK